MDLQKTILYVALVFTLMMMFQAWQQDYGPKPPAQTLAQGAPGTAPTTTGDTLPSAPSLGAAQQGAQAAPQPSGQLKRGERVKVRTDRIYAEIDTLGGDIRVADLLEYPVSVKEMETPTQILSDEAGKVHVAQSGLIPTTGSDLKLPNHEDTQFRAEQPTYRMAEGEDALQVRLLWSGDSGLEIAKVFTFHRGSHLIEVAFEVHNGGSEPFSAHMYRQLRRGEAAKASAFFIYTYTGGVVYDPEEKYQKHPLDKMEKSPLDKSASGGWLAMIQHYFLAAWIPNPEEKNHYYTTVKNGLYTLGMVGEAFSVAPGQSGSTSANLFVGPKLQHELSAIAPGLDLTVDYGVLTFIAKPLFWLLETIHAIVGSWGMAIILLTVLIKGAFYKLSETSYKSMAQIRKLQPRLQALKERHGDDKQKLNEAMMDMYKREKINPLGGCLPILVQIPVFIALYWTLLESVEMRMVSFLWLPDLSSADPYFILPLLMGASMLIQQKLNPTPLDPIQARVMMILPVVFTVFFLWFPSGLVLYWVVNNTLSIVQQWYITRRVITE